MKISRIAFFVAVVAALMLLVSGPGTRLGLWTFGTGFLLLRWALYLGLAAAVVSILLLAFRKPRTGNPALLVVAMLVGLGTAWFPYSSYRTARSVPPIHDITTDTVNPPKFVAVLPLRADARNPPEYAGEEVAVQQREAYPDVVTLTRDVAPADVFRVAAKTARDMGWEIVAEEPAAGRIEATATTFWFGFKDDVVIRIAAEGNGSRLDIRSKSRVGRSDVGANAARIRQFLSSLDEEI